MPRLLIILYRFCMLPLTVIGFALFMLCYALLIVTNCERDADALASAGGRMLKLLRLQDE